MKPLVSIITPTTKDRYNFNIQCGNYANKQDYPYIEHLFDFSDKTIGDKRNALCQKAKGEIIIHFDSDDFYANDYVSKSVGYLISSKADVTGLCNAYFYHPHTWLKKYQYKGTQGYAIGATLCYWREAWEKDKFKSISHGEDLYFLKNKIVKPHNYIDSFIAMVHNKNTTGTVKYKGDRYTPLSADLSKKILGNNYALYPMPYRS